MKIWSYVIAAAFAVMAAGSAQAAVLFSDDFQGPLSAAKWSTFGSAQIVANPLAGGDFAMNFASLDAGGDLFSNMIAGTGAGDYSIQFEYYSPTAGGGGSFVGLIPTSTTVTVPPWDLFDDWLATDTPGAYPTLYAFSSGADWTSVTINFSITSNTAWGLKIEDFGGSSPYIAGDAYIRNLTVSSVPEPATWAMFLLGFGAIGWTLRRRAVAATA